MPSLRRLAHIQKQAKSLMAGKTAAFTVRTEPERLAELDRRARTYGLTRSSYIMQISLGELDSDPDETTRRLDDLTTRLERIEQAKFEGW